MRTSTNYNLKRFVTFLYFRAKLLKSFSNSRKSSPSRTPVKKQSKMQSLLDPSRLRPPPMNASGGGITGSNTGNQNARLNLSLGVQLQHQQEQQLQLQEELGENEILSISQYHGETG